MKKKKPSRPAPRGRPSQKVSTTEKVVRRSRSRTLLVIDNEPIRADALRKYRTLEKQIAKVTAELEEYETADLPAYQRWEARMLGPLLSEVRTVQAELRPKQDLMGAIEEEQMWSGCSRLAAYRRVTRDLARAAAGEEDDDDDEGGGPNPFGGSSAGDESDPQRAERPRMFGDSDLPLGMTAAIFDAMSRKAQQEFRGLYAEVSAMYTMVTGLVAPELDDVLEAERLGQSGAPGAAQTAQAPRPKPAPDRRLERIKELYRELVRKLHPDHQGELTPRQKELWHQVQEAYQTRNLDLLEAISGRLEVTLDGTAAHLAVQTLLRITYELGESLRSLRGQLSQAKTQPAWNFRQKSAQMGAMATKRQRALKREIEAARNELAYLSSQIESLAAQVRKAEERKAKKKSPSTRRLVRGAVTQDQFSF